METIDIRFDLKTMEYIKSLIGKSFEGFKCDPFIFTNSVFGIIGILTSTSSCVITNFTEAMDYYGASEDVAVFKLFETAIDDIHSRLDNTEMVFTPVKNRISEICIVNEHQKLFKNNVQTYDVYITRGIIFKMADGLEISFEKNVWFSEMIAVGKGYNLLERFASVEEFTENWEGEFRGECTRNVINLD